MAITADKLRKRKNLSQMSTDLVAVKTAATVYIGALVCFQSTTGRVAAAAANATNNSFAGEVIAWENESGSVISAVTGNTGGTVKVLVGWGHQALVTLATGLRTTSKIGKLVYASDNDTVIGTAAGTAGVRVQVGNLASRVGSTEGYVTLRRLGATTTS